MRSSYAWQAFIANLEDLIGSVPSPSPIRRQIAVNASFARPKLPTENRRWKSLASRPASDNPNAFIFPHAASAKRTASLSNQFRDILVAAGLVDPRPRGHKSMGKGRDQAREASEISFHSLRHSAVTMLKAAGVSDFIAREIVGHESAAVSRQYTHLTTDDKRAAMRRLPDVTNG